MRNKISSQKIKAAIGFILIALIIAGTVGFLATLSVPGQTLYPVKTNVVEKTITLLHLSNRSKASYQVTLLYTRLEEVKSLASQESISEEAISALTKSITNQSEVFSTRINQSIDSAFPKTEVLKTVNEFATVATAIENISENTATFTSFSNTAEDIRQKAVLLYKEKANSFAATENPNDIYTYISNRLVEVTNALDVTTLNADSSESVELYLDRVEPALADKDFGKALIAIAEAERFIRIVPLGGEDILDSITYPEQTKTQTEASTTQATTSTSLSQ